MIFIHYFKNFAVFFDFLSKLLVYYYRNFSEKGYSGVFCLLVSKAETEAAAIIARAKDKAAEIVKAAEAEASAKLEKADKDAEAFTERSERTLEQSARDLLLSVGKNLEKMIMDLLNLQVEKSLDESTVPC